MTDMIADKLKFMTDGRGTGCRIVSDLAFFDDDFAEASMRVNPASCVVTFDHRVAYLEDEEIIEIAERIKARQAAIANAHGQEEK